MKNWYLVKVKFTKEFQDGTLKRVTEPYLVESTSFTESESRIYKEVGEFIRGEFLIKSIAKIDIADIFQYDDSDVWFESTISMVIINADNGKEGKIKNKFLISAENVDVATIRIKESLTGLMEIFEILKVAKTEIVEIFPYDHDFSKTQERHAEHSKIDNNGK